MTTLASLATRYAGRPLLLLPAAAQDLASRLHHSVPSAFDTGSRFDAALRAIGMRPAQRPAAFDDDDYNAQTVRERTAPVAYTPLWMGEPDDELPWGMSLKDGIATLNLDTAIADRGSWFCGTWWHGYDSLDAAMRTAFEDDRVKGIFLRMESPGGVVSGGLDALTQTIRAGREASGGKPVWVFADCAASAAYWIAAQADRIIAPKAGLVGSIGAVIVHMENAGFLAKTGIKVTPIEFGAQKTAGASFRALDDTARADLQAWVDQAGREFVEAVAEGRPVLTPQALLATEARVFTAYHADPERAGLDLQFVDEIMNEAEAFAALVDHVTPAMPAAASAGAPAVSPAASKGAGTMAKTRTSAARRKAERTALTARLAAIKAEEDLEKIEEEEEEQGLEAEGEEDDTVAEGEEDQAAAEGEEDDTLAEGEEDDTMAEGEEDDTLAEGEEEDVTSEDDEGKTPAARAKLRRLAIMGLPEAKGREAFARQLAAQGLSVKQAQGVLRSARRTGALRGRRDRPLGSAPSGSGGGDQVQKRLSAAVAGLGKRGRGRK